MARLMLLLLLVAGCEDETTAFALDLTVPAERIFAGHLRVRPAVAEMVLLRRRHLSMSDLAADRRLLLPSGERLPPMWRLQLRQRPIRLQLRRRERLRKARTFPAPAGALALRAQ